MPIIEGTYRQTVTTINVRDYGAIGNGTTDDLAAINSAITGLSGSGDLCFPKGTYRIASNLTMATGIRYVPEQGAMISVDGIAMSAITKANPGEVTTSSAHGFSNGDKARFKDVGGMVELNYSTNGGVEYTVTVVSTTKFTIGVNTSAYTTYTSGGYSQHILTISGPIDAGLYQIFTGNGAVSLGTNVEFARPEWFGEVGASNDDAITFGKAYLSHDVIKLAAKTYRLSSLDIAKNNVSIYGEGYKTIIWHHADITENMFNIHNCYGFQLHDVKLMETIPWTNTGKLIRIANCDDINIHDIWIYGGYDQIQIYQSDDIFIHSNIIEGSRRYSVHMYQGVLNRVLDNTFFGMGNTGAANAASIQIEKDPAYSCRPFHNIIANNYFYYGRYAHFIRADKVSALTISGNTFSLAGMYDANSKDDIQLIDSEDVTIVGNTSKFEYSTYMPRYSITSITNANPGVVTTSTVHGRANGNSVIIEDATGMTELNDRVFTVANATAYSFDLQGENTTLYGVHIASTGYASDIRRRATRYCVNIDANCIRTTIGVNAFVTGLSGVINDLGTSTTKTHLTGTDLNQLGLLKYRKKRVATSTPYGIALTDEIIEANVSGGPIAITLPFIGTGTPQSQTGDFYTIKKVDASLNNVANILPRAGETIDGKSSWGLFTKNDFVTIVNNGTEWKIIAYRVTPWARAETITPNYADEDDRNYFFDATAENKNLVLPFLTGVTEPLARAGQEITIKKIDSTGNIVTITARNPGTPETIDGASYYILTTQYDFITVKAAEAGWNIVSKHTPFVAKNNTDTSTSGTGEDNLKSTTIPGNLMGFSGLKIKAVGTKTNANGNKTIKLYWGPDSWTIHAAANNVNDWRVEAEICNITVSTQRISWICWDGTTILQGYETSAQNTASNVILKLTGECAHASDVITQTMWEVGRT